MQLTGELWILSLLARPGHRARRELCMGLRGAALAELAFQDHLALEFDDERRPIIIALNPATTGSWVLDAVRHRVAARAPCHPSVALEAVPDGLDEAIAEELLERRILRRPFRVPGLRGSRYRLADPELGEAIRKRVRAGLLAGSADHARSAALMQLAAICRASTAGALFDAEEIAAGVHNVLFGRLYREDIESGFALRPVDELAPADAPQRPAGPIAVLLDLAEGEAAAARPADWWVHMVGGRAA